MKRLLVAASALILVTGCGATTDGSGGGAEPATSAAVALTADETSVGLHSEPPQSTAETVSSESDVSAAVTSDYAVTINGSRVTKDYKGRPALIVDLTFTNNSDEAQGFAFATRAQAFQDGIELESAMFIDDDSYDSANSMKDIKPGKSIDVQEAYVLDSKADVEIEVTELFSFEEVSLAKAVISVK